MTSVGLGSAPTPQAQAGPQNESFTPATGTVASLARIFEQAGAATIERRQGAPSGPAAAAQPPAAAASPAPHVSKRQRLGSMSAHPPLPAEWTTSPPLAHDGSGASSAAASSAPLEGRQLWGDDGSEDAAAREARLAKIRAKFGSKRFYPARELPPAELRALLGAAEADLSPDDCEWCGAWVHARLQQLGRLQRPRTPCTQHAAMPTHAPAPPRPTPPRRRQAAPLGRAAGGAQRHKQRLRPELGAHRSGHRSLCRCLAGCSPGAAHRMAAHSLPLAHARAVCLAALAGQSGCVGLASSAAFLFVLGAGQTIYLEEADAVRAARDEAVSAAPRRPAAPAACACVRCKACSAGGSPDSCSTWL